VAGQKAPENDRGVLNKARAKALAKVCVIVYNSYLSNQGVNMYQVIQAHDKKVLFTGTQAQCWEYLEDEGLHGGSFYVMAM
jgi:ribosomal protein S2